MEYYRLRPLRAAAQTLLRTSLVVALCLRLFTDIVVLPDDPTSLLIFQLNPFSSTPENPVQSQAEHGVWVLMQDENGLPGQTWYENITDSATLAVLLLLNVLIRARTLGGKLQAGKSKNSTSA